MSNPDRDFRTDERAEDRLLGNVVGAYAAVEAGILTAGPRHIQRASTPTRDRKKNNQPTLADPIPGWGPVDDSYPVNNPAARRVGWFVDDGTCHGEPAQSGHTNALGSNLHTRDDGMAEYLQSESEEDAVTLELSVGPPTSTIIDEASPTLAILMDKSNVIAVAPASADKLRVPVSDNDVGHQTDSGRVAASEQGGDENAPTASTSGLMSVADALALWARSENTPVSSFTLSQPPTAGRAWPSQSPAVDTVERDDAVNGNEEMLDSEQADDEDNGHYNFIVKLHARPYLGHSNSR